MQELSMQCGVCVLWTMEVESAGAINAVRGVCVL